MQKSLYYSVPAFSLTPSKLVLRDAVYKASECSNTPSSPFIGSGFTRRFSNLLKNGSNVVNRFTGFEISVNARKNLIEKINWLYFLSKSRYQKTASGKELFNFRINFVTLTLPAKQFHNTAEITKNGFNHFLTELRKAYNIENYVWRLEFQQNGNVHYHLVTDVFLDYSDIRDRWNRILLKLGYVQKYTEKHAKMSLNDYVNEYSKGDYSKFELLKKRYYIGRSSGWSQPNSVDVKPVLGQKKIAFYISKYFSKKSKNRVNCNELDNEENSKGLRLWFCSRSLSKLKKISDFIPAFDVDVLSHILTDSTIFKVVHQYCTVIYFSVANLVSKSKGIISQLLRRYAFSLNYKPAIS